jgi:dihydropyrimidine dehydrogenase (NAD+) subunit PreA
MPLEPELAIEFCGLRFAHPFILPSAQSVRTGAMIRRAFQAGWAGAVTQTLSVNASSICNVRPRLQALRHRGALVGLMNVELIATRSLSDWLADIAQLKSEYPDRPIIASLMGEGSRPEEWIELAKRCEAAGADGLELNLSCPHGMPERGTGAFIGQDAERTAQVTGWVTAATRLPVIVKLTPNVTDIVAIARAAREAGAAGVTAINNLKALAGVDVERLVPLPDVQGQSVFGGYAGPGLKPVGLRCVAEIAQGLPSLPIAGTGGIESWQDAVEYLLVGATLVQVYTLVVENGFAVLHSLLDGLRDYLGRHHIARVSDLIGAVLPRIITHGALPRSSEIVAGYTRSLCSQCGQCYIACEDAGFQAIRRSPDNYPVIDPMACDGCGLCVALCPVEKCMWMERIGQSTAIP